jgi:hypothetical protein
MFQAAGRFAIFAGLALLVGVLWDLFGVRFFPNRRNERWQEGAKAARVGARVWIVIGIASAVVALVLLLVELVS